MAKFYWHVQLDCLVEPLIELIENQIAFIRKNKPKSEIETRLRLMKPVRGQLPILVVKAGAACEKVWAAYEKARAAYERAASEKMWVASRKAIVAYRKKWATCEKMITDNMPAIEALHRKECPNCPWDGKTIFPNKEG